MGCGRVKTRNVRPVTGVGVTSKRIMKDMHNLMGSDGNIDLRVPSGASHVIKGGSYLCNPGFCMRYRPAARQHHDYTMGTSHVGFRTVINGEK